MRQITFYAVLFLHHLAQYACTYAVPTVHERSFLIELIFESASTQKLECECTLGARLQDLPTMQTSFTQLKCGTENQTGPCLALLKGCMCTRLDVSLQLEKRGLTSFFSKCFKPKVDEDEPLGTDEEVVPEPVAAGEFAKTVSEFHLNQARNFVDQFLVGKEAAPPVREYQVRQFRHLNLIMNALLDEKLTELSITDEHIRLFIKEQVNGEFGSRFMPTFDESRATFLDEKGVPSSEGPASSEEVKTRFAEILKEFIDATENPGKYDKVMKGFSVITMEDFTKDIEGVKNWLEENGLEEGVLLTSHLTNIGGEGFTGKSVDWIASEIMNRHGLRPKSLLSHPSFFDTEVRVDDFKKIVQEKMDALTEEARMKLEEDNGEVPPLKIFIIDDASYSGNQVVQIVKHLQNYQRNSQDHAPIDVYLAITRMSETAKGNIIELKKDIQSKSDGISFHVYEHAKPIETLDKGAGFTVFEHKIPDSASFAGPEMFEIEMTRTRRNPYLAKALPPYKRFAPILHPPS